MVNLLTLDLITKQIKVTESNSSNLCIINWVIISSYSYPLVSPNPGVSIILKPGFPSVPFK